jgi:diguanylate cyclase (GGDEF)-like protein
MPIRNDALIIAIVVFVGCLVALSDPGHFFEWLSKYKEAQVDELLVGAIIIGSGLALFSWRRWSELSRQVAEYQRVQTELSKINREASLMSETDELLQSCLSSKESFKIVIQHIEAELPDTSGAIYTIADDRSTVELAAQWGTPALGGNAFAPEDCWALRRGRVNVFSGGDSRVMCAHIGTDIPTQGMCVPMMAQGETIGVLSLQDGTNPGQSANHLSEDKSRMVKTLAEHLALAVANLQLRERLRSQSIRDPLTNLFNRRYMEESLARELHRATRKKSTLSIMAIDVDHFKRFNDTYGHEAGDKLLQELAQVFCHRLRGDDVACRYGGEEFILILPEAPLEAASERAEQLRQAIEKLKLDYHGQKLENISVSVGVSCFPQHGTAPDVLLRTADAALYRAKEQGRNRVISA